MPAAAPIVGAGLGLLSGVSSGRRQERLAEQANAPQPFEQTDAPAPWLAPWIQEAGQVGRGLFQQQLENPFLPPTFNQALAGGYQSPMGGLPGYRGELPWAAEGSSPPPGGGGGPGDPGGPGGRDLIAMLGGSPGGHLPVRPGGFGGGGRESESGALAGERDRRQGYGGGRGGGGGRRGGRRGGERSNALTQGRDAMMQMLLSRAAQPPPQAIGTGLDFLSGVLSGSSDPAAAMRPALRQQNQTYRDIRGADSPLNQLIGHGLGGGLNASTAPQLDFISQLGQRWQQPPALAPTSYGHLDIMSQASSPFRMFDIGGRP